MNYDSLRICDSHTDQERRVHWSMSDARAQSRSQSERMRACLSLSFSLGDVYTRACHLKRRTLIILISVLSSSVPLISTPSATSSTVSTHPSCPCACICTEYIHTQHREHRHDDDISCVHHVEQSEDLRAGDMCTPDAAHLFMEKLREDLQLLREDET